jgi:SAM-dependent methyltransferase
MPDKRTIHFYNINAENLYNVYRKVERGVSIYFKSFFEPDTKILEIGFGSGRDLATLLDNGLKANGIEASISMLNIAKKNYPKLAIRVWLDSLPDLKTIEDESYDAVLCSAVLMHINEDELPIAIKNISRIVRKKGKLLISVPSVRNDVDPETSRDQYGRLYNNYSSRLYIEMFKLAGFRLVFQEENKDAMKRKFNWITIGFVKE